MTAHEILKNLVAFDTVADRHNREIMEYIEAFFAPLGFTVTRTPSAESGKETLTARYGGEAAIGFLGHTDTVDVTDGWETDPYTLTERDGMLYGLGACDMKGGIAAFMSAIANTDLRALKKGVGVYCTYDEEIMFGGIRDMVASHTVFAPHTIIAEPTDLTPITASKGLLEYVFTFTGVTTHSSMPIDGKNANKNAVEFLHRMLGLEQELRRSQNPFFSVPYTTMNIGILRGGTAINKVPDKATVYLDFRICDSKTEYPVIRRFVDTALEGLDGSYTILNDIPSFRNDSRLIGVYEEKTGRKTCAFPGITEASFLKGERVILGPGPVTAHQANEHVSAASLARTEEIYSDMIRLLCR